MFNIHTVHQTTLSITAEQFISLCKRLDKEDQYQQVIQIFKEMSSVEANLIIHDKDNLAFRLAAEKGCIEVIKLLIEFTPDTELLSKMIHAANDQAFHNTARYGHPEVMKLLIEFTPDPELRSSMIHANNDEAFCYAARNGNTEVIKLFLEFTPDPELRSSMIHANNDKAFCYAASNGNAEVIKLFLEFTPDPELRSSMIHANNDQSFRCIAGPMETVYNSNWFKTSDFLRGVGQYPMPSYILRDGNEGLIRIFLELETDYFENLARSLTLTPGTVKFIAETSQNIRAASSNGMVVYYVSEIKFDNIIFAHPQLLLEAWKIGSKSSVNNLIDLGQDKELAETIIDAVNTYGAKHVLEIIFGSNNIHSNINPAQPNERTLAVIEKTPQAFECNQDAVISSNLILASFAAKEAIEILPTIKYFVKELLKIQYELPAFVDNNYFKLTAHFIVCNIGAFAITGKLDIASVSLPTAIYGGKILTYEYLAYQKQLNFKNTEDKSIDNSVEFIQKCGFDIATQTAFGIVTSFIFGSSSMMYDVAISATVGGMQCYDLYNAVNSFSDQSVAIIPYIIDATVLYGATKNMNFDFNTQIGQMFAIKQVSVALSSVVITDYMTKLLLANIPETCSNYLSNIAGDIYNYFNADSAL